MRLVGIAFSFMLLTLASCGGGTLSTQAPDETYKVPPAPLNLDIPAPSEIIHTVQANSDTQADGSAFLPAPCSNVIAIAPTAEYMPDWPVDGSGPFNCAYAVYGFTIDLEESFSAVHVNWHSAPSGWIGLSNYASDSWDWVSSATQAALPGNLADYVSADDEMYVVLSAIGVGTFLLNELTLTESGSGGDFTNLFFLHHSTGEGIINGGVRDAIDNFNAVHSTSFEFWDHGYNYDGLFDAAGNPAGCYDIPGDNTDPDGLHYLWTSAEAEAADCRDLILANHDVIAFKSCFPASDIWDAAELQERKDWYLAMRDFFDTRTDRLFVVLSTPPLHPDVTTADNAARARQFADWLKSGDYLAGHPNVVCFDLFDQLASDGSDGPVNTLRTSYQPEEVDSHPNETGNQAVAPVFANFLCDTAAFSTE
jgi:hypothetical protein